jgi:hypothetical protein
MSTRPFQLKRFSVFQLTQDALVTVAINSLQQYGWACRPIVEACGRDARASIVDARSPAGGQRSMPAAANIAWLSELPRWRTRALATSALARAVIEAPAYDV